MTKQAATDVKKLVKLLEKLGYVNKSAKGTYLVFERPGNAKNLMIRQASELNSSLLNEILLRVSDQTDVHVDDLKKMLNEL